MKLKSLLTTTILAITAATAQADEQFSTLGGIQAQVMTAAEMESVQGKTDIYQQIMNNTDPLGQQLSQFYQGVIQQNVADPRVQAGYNAWIANGGGGTIEEFAYGWAATGGYSAQGLANYGATSAQINVQQQQAITNYFNSQGTYAEAYGEYTGGFQGNITEAGNGLMGNGTFYNPNTGTNEVLPYTWQPRTVNTYNGSNYYVDGLGTYWQMDPSGYFYGLSPTYGQ